MWQNCGKIVALTNVAKLWQNCGKIVALTNVAKLWQNCGKIVALTNVAKLWQNCGKIVALTNVAKLWQNCGTRHNYHRCSPPEKTEDRKKPIPEKTDIAPEKTDNPVTCHDMSRLSVKVNALISPEKTILVTPVTPYLTSQTLLFFTSRYYI
jgi:hypothetical protein